MPVYIISAVALALALRFNSCIKEVSELLTLKSIIISAPLNDFIT